ncbi:MAG TPA: aldo/keto reductase [Bacilli bacterium]|nr:aldo/keto reductase [Bacilli bacterium]
MITGFATGAGTKRYAAIGEVLRYKPLNGTGLLVSEAGFGCYRVTVDDASHVEALKEALGQGINLIDTSANYWDGDSELLVGTVLAEMIGGGALNRDEVVVVSKVGYLQGLNFALSQQRKQAGKPFPDLVEYGDGLEHCIHPEFLEDQLTRSLERLGLETLDVYLLHNPEYYLSFAKGAGVPVEAARREYERRLELALRHLEQEAERGRIKCYGISSNTFPAAADSAEFTSLERVWGIAEAISPDHHFKVIQFPMNLIEAGAETERNQAGGTQTVLEFAVAHDLGVLINRPFNAIVDGSLQRLVDVKRPDDAPTDEIPALLEGLMQRETTLQRNLLPKMGLSQGERANIADKLSLGSLLAEHWNGFNSQAHWMDALQRLVVPMLQHGMRSLADKAQEHAEVEPWVQGYMEQVNPLLAAITAHYQELEYRQKQELKQRVDTLDADWTAAGSLSHVALRALRSTEGVTTVLVGMRQVPYVQDVLAELSQPVDVAKRQEAWERATTLSRYF